MNARVNHFTRLLRRLRGFLRRLGRWRVDARPDQLPDLTTQEALRDSEERLRLVRRATGLGRYELDWMPRRHDWSPEPGTLLRVPPELDIRTASGLREPS